VQITDEELEALEAEANRSIDLKDFVPLESVEQSRMFEDLFPPAGLCRFKYQPAK
jgi:non-homologous end joining protein Ku